jgi:predicted AAA+ superfamily ATPase
MFKRNITENLIQAIQWNPVVLLTGARQTGKTTLMKEICQAGFEYITFDNIQQQALAKSDPITFINSLKKPVILDEIQRVPEIFLTIKQNVDESRKDGMYALTGSANPLLIPKLGDSLTGRIAILELHTLSQGEILGIKEDFIAKAFANSEFVNPSKLNNDDLCTKINIGGYPGVQNFDSERRDSWFDSYMTTILQRDVRELSNLSDISLLSNLCQILATRAGNLLNISDVCRVSKIPNSTLHRYLTLLETIFLTYNLNCWSSNLETRLVKSPKIYLNDTGILLYLLGFTLDKQKSLEGRIFGPVLENFIINELRKQLSWSSKKRVKVYYFRNVSGVEVDVVLEDQQGNVVAIEIKSSGTISPTDFKNIKYLQELINKKNPDKFRRGIVFYTGNEILNWGEKLSALPINCLWEN